MNKIIPVFLALFFLLSFLVTAGSRKNKPMSTSVKGDLYLTVSQKHIKVNLQYQYVPNRDGVSEISFYLTNEVNIDQLKGEAIEAYKFDKDAKPFATLTISFKKPLEKETAASFTLSYSGALSKGFWTDNYNWIDVDPDFMILPLFTDFTVFNYDIHAELDDPNYKFLDVRDQRMSSDLNINAESVFYFESVVAGSEMNFRRINEGDNSVNIISNKPDSIVQHLGNKGLEILNYFNSTIGEKKKVNGFSVLYRPMPDSVFRTIRSLTDERFIMFSSNHERIPTLAHEISHFWWNRGNDFTMEKWLDESFAEYSKLMYIRDIQSQDRFQEEINLLEKEVEDLPSILKSDRFGKNWSGILYKKGPYLLYQLEELLGKERFIQLLSKLNEEDVSTTEGMLNELETISSSEVSDTFREKLNK
jgi:hypothetical protein